MREQSINLKSLQNLMHIKSEEEWSKAILQTAERMGFDRALFAILKNKLEPLENAFLRSTFPQEWRDHYDKNRYGYIDPTVIHCLRSPSPLIWSPHSFNSACERNMYEEAARYGLGYGIIFPMFGPNGEFGVFSFSSTSINEKNYEEVMDTFLPQLSTLKDFAFEPACFHASDQTITNQLTLTSREKEVLGWTVEGKSCWEISKILGCSEATIHYHMNKLRRKLCARSKQQIMVKAITLGLIHA